MVMNHRMLLTKGLEDAADAIGNVMEAADLDDVQKKINIYQ